MFSWDQIYSFLGIKDFIYFISSPAIQDALFPIKIVFVLFTAFFFCAVIYFYIESSYLKYKFTEDVTEFFSWQAYGLREVDRKWKEISRKTSAGSERDLKVAIVEADDFLKNALQDADLEGDTFESLVSNAEKRILPNANDILQAHAVRNSIVHDVNYHLDFNTARKILNDYEKAIRNAYIG